MTEAPKLLDTLLGFSPTELQDYQERLVADTADLKTRKDVFEAALERKYGDLVQNAYLTAKKDTGTVNVAASNTLDLKIERDKTVVWDQAKLRAALDSMNADTARHYAKVSIEIPEAKYNAAPPDIQKTLAEARSIKVGKNKFTFKPNKEAMKEAA